MSMVGFPLLLIPLAIYNIVVFLMPGVSLTEPLATLPLTSGAQWPVTLSDAFLALGILMLLFEVIKGARPGAKYLTDHLLSLIMFGGAAAEFLLWPRFGNSTYFLLTLLALTDFASGVALRARRGTPAAAGAPRPSRRAAEEAHHEVIEARPHAEDPTPPSTPHGEAAPTHAEPTFAPAEAAHVSPAPEEAATGEATPRPSETR